jgi:hypothetical protein
MARRATAVKAATVSQRRLATILALEGPTLVAAGDRNPCCCRRRGNRRRDRGGDTLSLGDVMKDEENQPTNKCNQTAGNGDEHEPAHHAE